MTQMSAATAFDHDSTLVLALELSGKGWEVGAVLPGVAVACGVGCRRETRPAC
jgi:hypothetical protein